MPDVIKPCAPNVLYVVHITSPNVAAARGALVGSVERGGPGEAAGILPGDVLLTYGGTEVTARFDEQLPGAYQLIADTPIGTDVPMVLLRRNEEVSLTVTTVETGRLTGEEFEAEA